VNFEYDESSDEVIVDFGCGTRRVECYVNANQLAALERLRYVSANQLAALERLRAENKSMVNSLRWIAGQKKTDELITEFDAEYADFEGGYDAIIDVARAELRGEEK
jgi:hypothetical protein